MKTVKVLLNSIETVKEFVATISKIDCDMDLVSGKYKVDAKSILGIFSMNLSDTLDLNIHADGPVLNNAMTAVLPYLAA